MIKGIHHIALAVADLGAAERFHCQAAQLRPVDAAALDLPLPGGASAARMLAGANCALRLLEVAADEAGPLRPVSQAGITHYCLQSVDMKALHASFEGAGASFHSGPVDLGTGFLYCYSRDLEANVIELEGVAPVWEDPRPWFAHVAISSYGLPHLAGFYEAVFGSTAKRSPRLANNRRMDRVAGLPNVALEAAWIPGPNLQVELMQYFEPATVQPESPPAADAPGYSYIALEVDDVQAELARLCRLGAREPQELAHYRRDRLAFCADPEGNLLLLLSIKPAHQALSFAALPDPFIAARLAASTPQKDSP